MKRAKLFVPPITLERGSRVPLSRQIQSQIAQQIRGGAVQGEARLPSTRMLARLLGVSRNTVLEAYEELAADDLVRGCRGVGMRVNSARAVGSATLTGLRHAVRAANYPARVLALTDPDGNLLYVNDAGR